MKNLERERLLEALDRNAIYAAGEQIDGPIDPRDTLYGRAAAYIRAEPKIPERKELERDLGALLFDAFAVGHKNRDVMLGDAWANRRKPLLARVEKIVLSLNTE